MTKRNLQFAITLFAMSALLCAWTLWPSVQGATGASPNSNAQAALKLPKISISLWFGRASKGCRGWGICKITVGKLSAAEKGKTVQAELSRTDDGKLELRLLEKAAEADCMNCEYEYMIATSSIHVLNRSPGAYGVTANTL